MEGGYQAFEILEHPADVGFLARGRTLKELFANAGLALSWLGWEVEGVGESERREIEVSGEDTESLLYEWLAAILAISDAERLVLKRFELSELGAGRARGVAWGERWDRSRHRARTYIKAVTLHQFEVREIGGGWAARVYVDV